MGFGMWGNAKRVEQEPEAPPALTVNDVLDAYLKEKRNPYAERVCLTADSIEHHLKPLRELWGAMTVDEFADKCRQRVRDQVIEWRKLGWELNTCRTRLSKLRTAFNYAVNEELIDKAPVFKLPPSGPPRERVIDVKDELARFLDALDHPSTPRHIRFAGRFLMTVGCRKGALLDLKWENVDFENRVIRLRDTQTAEVRRTNKKRRENQPIDQALYDLLWEHKQHAKTEWVVEWRGARCKSIYGGMRAVFARAGIEGCTTHDIRRSSATLLFNKLRDMNAAAQHLGDTPEMAAKVYVQQDIATKLPGIEAISAIIKAAREV